MTVFNIVTHVVGFALAAASILSQVELWQRKEYRIDRLLAALRDREMSPYYLPLLLFGLILSVLALFLMMVGQLQYASVMSLVLILAVAAHHGWRIKRRGLFRPKLTVKAVSVLAIVGLVTTTYIVLLPQFLVSVQWAVVVMIIPFLTVVAVAVVNVPFAIRKQQVIQKAKRRRRALPNITVVGITGSYGKTTTKHFLHQILLAADIKVAVTEDHRNSPYVVAQDMLRQLTPGLNVYVAEMGAYRKGEIASLAKLTRPAIGVITAISNQHLGLFGSAEKIIATKWELIDHLGPQGTAVLNKSDKATMQQARKIKTKIIWYAVNQPTDVYSDHVDIRSREVVADIHLASASRSIKLSLLGEGMIESVVAAAAVAHALGVSSQVIFSALGQLSPPPRTMQLVRGNQDTTIIDDSYSANERGVIVALNHLARFTNSKKIAVVTPLIELGKQAPAVHQRLGRAAAVADVVYFTGPAFHLEFAAGLHAAGGKTKFEVVSDAADLCGRIKRQVSDDTVILLEGRVPQIVRDTVLNS